VADGRWLESDMTSDPVADMLTRIRNAIKARHSKVDVPASKLKVEIARILREEGYILNYKVAEEGPKKTIKVYLKYQPNNKPVIASLERISRPGCRVFAGHEDVPTVLGGLGVSIMTTPKGVMTGRDARKQGVGGEVLCQIS
jgi:small subunit ribosomal protein S8